MLNQVKSTFSVTSPHSEAKALVEAFARQDKQRFYPFELQNFKLGVRFQNADPQTQRVIVMATLAWLDQHSLKSYGRQDQNAWQVGWKMREAFLHMLQVKIPFQENDVVAMLNWSASQSNTSVYVYFSGVPQIINVLGDYLENNPMSAELHAAIERLTQSLESKSVSVEIRRWLLRLKELMGETPVSLPLVAGDRWADTALRELYALDTRTKTAWTELLKHCSRAKGATPSRQWLTGADKYIESIGKLNFFVKLSHWFPRVDKPQMASANATILKGLIWLCGRSEDPEIALALAALAISSYEKTSGSRTKTVKLGNACCWALGKMPIDDGTAQLRILKVKVRSSNAQELIEKALEMAARR